MKIKELIMKLQEYPEDMEVFCNGKGSTYFPADSIVREPFLETHRFFGYNKVTKTAFTALRPCKETAGAEKCLIL